MYNFLFEYINEDQLKTVVQRVKRSKRSNRENDEWTSYVSKKEKHSAEFVILDSDLPEIGEELHSVHTAGIDLPIEVPELVDKINCREYTHDSSIQPATRCYPNDSFNQFDKNCYFILRILDLRHKLLKGLDSLLLQNEKDLLEKKLFQETLNRLKETGNRRKLTNCLYRIRKLDYQLVNDFRKLSLHATGDDMLSLLKILSECHSTASKMFQVFVYGWPDLKEVTTTKEKLCELLKCLITLTRICKWIGLKHRAIVNSYDFLVNDMNKKCKYILHILNKKSGKEIQKKYRANMKASPDLNKDSDECRTCQLYKTSNIVRENIPKNTLYIPMKRFKKLAKHTFGAKERCEDNQKTSLPGLSNSCASIRITGHLKEKNKAKSKDDNSMNNISKDNCRTSAVNSKGDTEVDRISIGIQHSSSNENNMEIFDKSFSKKLYATLESEIHSNIHEIFRNLSRSQPLFISYQTGGLSDGKQTFSSKNSINPLNKLKDPLHTVQIEELSLEKRNERNLERHVEVVELNIESSKQISELKALTNGQDEYTELIKTKENEEKNKPTTESYHSLLMAEEFPSCVCKFMQEDIVDFGKPEFSKSNTSLIEHKYFNEMMEEDTPCSALTAKTLDTIERISEKLIAESVNSISCELDFIVRKMFDLEFS